MNFIDPLTTLSTESEPLNKERLGEIVRKFKRLANQVELFLHESPHNYYFPPAPEGYFALRSSKRRIFISNRYKGTQFDLSEILKSGEFIEEKL